MSKEQSFINAYLLLQRQKVASKLHKNAENSSCFFFCADLSIFGDVFTSTVLYGA